MLRTAIPTVLMLAMVSCAELYFWQKAKPDSNYQAIRIEQGDSVLVFNIGSKQEVKTIPEATYFWFNSKEIKYTQGAFSGNPLDGTPISPRLRGGNLNLAQASACALRSWALS